MRASADHDLASLEWGKSSLAATLAVVPIEPPETGFFSPIFVPSENVVVVASLIQADASAAGGGCDLTSPVQAALQQNPSVLLDLGAMSNDRLSVARGLAIWNDIWTLPDERLLEATLGIIRKTVRATVLAATEACNMQLQAGPSFIYLQSGQLRLRLKRISRMIPLLPRFGGPRGSLDND